MIFCCIWFDPHLYFACHFRYCHCEWTCFGHNHRITCGEHLLFCFAFIMWALDMNIMILYNVVYNSV